MHPSMSGSRPGLMGLHCPKHGAPGRVTRQPSCGLWVAATGAHAARIAAWRVDDWLLSTEGKYQLIL